MPEASPPRRRLAPRRQAANVGLALLTRSGSPATMRPIGAAATAGVLAVVVAACGQREEPAGEPPPHGTRLVVTVRPGGPGGMPDVREIECLPHARRPPCVRLETVGSRISRRSRPASDAPPSTVDPRPRPCAAGYADAGSMRGSACGTAVRSPVGSASPGYSVTRPPESRRRYERRVRASSPGQRTRRSISRRRRCPSARGPRSRRGS